MSFANPAISDVVATTIQSRTGIVADNVTKNNAILMKLREQGNIKPFGGGNVTTSGEVGNAYALRALADAPGGPDAIWASLLRTDAPGYGWMLTMGETALAESWTDAKGDSHVRRRREPRPPHPRRNPAPGSTPRGGARIHAHHPA